MDHTTLALMIPLGGLATGALSIYLFHVRKLAEIKARSGTLVNERENVSGSVAAEVAELREEVRRLRDTTTKFDLSFDAGLTRVEDRVARIEDDLTSTRYNTGRKEDTATLIAR